MATTFEQKLLHGGLSTSSESSSPPHRASSPSTSDELGSDLDDSKTPHSSSLGLSTGQPRTSGPQTGVKGVRADAKASRVFAKEKRAAVVNGINRRMESMALGRNRTWKEDEEDRARRAAGKENRGDDNDDENIVNGDYDEDEDDDSELDEIRARRMEEIKSTQAASNEARRKRMAGEDVLAVADDKPKGLSPAMRPKGLFGHLREVGPGGYAQAIDGEDDATMIVVHIYVKVRHSIGPTLSLVALALMTFFLSARTARSCLCTAHDSSLDAGAHESQHQISLCARWLDWVWPKWCRSDASRR